MERNWLDSVLPYIPSALPLDSTSHRVIVFDPNDPDALDVWIQHGGSTIYEIQHGEPTIYEWIQHGGPTIYERLPL